MPGINTGLSLESKISFLDNYKTELLYSDNMKIIDLDLNKITSFLNINENYPWFKYTYKGYNILLLGVIYDLSDLEVQKYLNNIVDNFGINYNYIKEFVESVDGDYLIQIESPTNELIVFNDLLGRLPCYYFFSDKSFFMSSEFKFILNNMKKVKLDMVSVQEYILNEYMISNNTLFHDIKKINPSEILHFKYNENKCELININNFNLVFNNKKPMNKNCFLQKLNNQIKVCIKNRLLKLNSKNYNFISDISGGFDSRTIAALLSNYNYKVDYHTYEYIQDESIISREVINKLYEDRAKFIKLKGDNSLINAKDSKDDIYNTDALTNYYTSSVCLNDLKTLELKTQNNTVRFMGLGVSDFLRHPMYSSPFVYLNNFSSNKGWYKKIYNTSNMLDLNNNELKIRLNNFFDSIKEKSINSKLKRLYFEYQRNYVSLAGEDRERIAFWTVLPLFSAPMMKIISENYNLNWFGFKLYIKFMNKINIKTTEIKIYNRKINLSSKISIFSYDAIFKLRVFLLKFKHKFPLLEELINVVKRKKINTEKNEIIVHIEESKFSDLLVKDRSFLYKLDDIELKRLLTLCYYFELLEKNLNVKVIGI